jgi:hypothetical protein
MGILFVVWPILAFVGYVVGALWIGLWLQGRRGPTNDPAARPYGAMLLGLLITFVLGFVPLFTFVVSLFGMGAVLLATWRTLRAPPSPAFVSLSRPAPLAS